MPPTSTRVKSRVNPAAGNPPAAQQPIIAQPPTPPIEINGVQGVHPAMIASLPSIASGADVYARQFYRANANLPFRRYLPINVQ